MFPLLLFSEETEESSYDYSLNYLVDFTSEPAGKLLVIDSISLIHIRLFRLSVSPRVSFGR